jgi:hypothetical protein
MLPRLGVKADRPGEKPEFTPGANKPDPREDETVQTSGWMKLSDETAITTPIVLEEKSLHWRF